MNPIPSNFAPRKLSFFLWAIAAWAAWAGLSYGISPRQQDDPGCGILLLASMGLVLPASWFAAVASRAVARVFRVIFWMGQMLGALLLSIMVGESGERIFGNPMSKPLLGTGLALMVLGGIWTGVRITRQCRLRSRDDLRGGRLWWLADCGYAALTLVVTPAIAWLFTEYVYIPRVMRHSRQKWAQIGRPMEGLEKQCKEVEENNSFRELMRDLAPFGINSFYRNNDGEKSPNHCEIPVAVVTVFGASHGDEVVFGAPTDRSNSVNPTPTSEQAARSFAAQCEEVKAYLSTHAGDFDRLYQGILRREPPVWACDLNNKSRKIPDFLGVRKLSQLIAADARLKLKNGDMKGAAVAYAATDRMMKGLSQNPYFVSFMIRVAVDALMDGNVGVRLPEEPETLKAAAEEASSKREQFQRRLQFSARDRFRQALAPVTDSSDNDQAKIQSRFWVSRLIEKLVKPVFLQLDAAKAAGILAQDFEVCERARDFADLGEEEIDRINRAQPTITGPSIARAYLRTNFCLLLHEETAVLRAARAQMAAGKLGAQGKWASAVAPGSSWLVTGNPSDHSVNLKLSPLPQWVTKREVVDDAFFPVLPDGSNSWKFSTPL